MPLHEPTAGPQQYPTEAPPSRRGPEGRPKAKRRPEHPDDAVARKASRQLGLIAYWQAIALHLTDDQVRRRLARRQWRALQQSVYLINGAPDGWKVRVMAACLAAGFGRDGVTVAASHATAARLHGLAGVEQPERIDVLVTANRHLRLAGVRVRRTRQLAEEDVTTVDGVPVTTGERTVLDLADADGSRTAVLRLLDNALYGKVARRKRLHERARALRKGRAGAELIVRLTAPDGKAEFRSWLERHSAGVFRTGGLPEPEWNAVLRDERGRIGEIDVVWRVARLVVELDGLRFHSTPAQRRRDARRDRRLTLAGWTVLRYTWLDVVERPDEVVTEVARALGAES